MYLIKNNPGDERKLEMCFDCSAFQYQLKEQNKPFDDHVFQTIFLNKKHQHLWSHKEIREDKISASLGGREWPSQAAASADPFFVAQSASTGGTRCVSSFSSCALWPVCATAGSDSILDSRSLPSPRSSPLPTLSHTHSSATDGTTTSAASRGCGSSRARSASATPRRGPSVRPV